MAFCVYYITATLPGSWIAETPSLKSKFLALWMAFYVFPVDCTENNELTYQRCVHEKEILLDVCQLVVSLQCCCNEYGSVHPQRVLLQTEGAHNQDRANILKASAILALSTFKPKLMPLDERWAGNHQEIYDDM